MRVCVSTIMKNEPPAFIERWAESVEDADERVLVDTGSTNNAVECARDLGVTVHEIRIRPWRFDTARNTALALVDDDINVVVKVDVDEILWTGWRDALENAPYGERYSYRYIWNHFPDGEPNIEFTADHTHRRWGWQWRHPVHEALHRTDKEDGFTVFVPGMVIEHLADDNKSRAQYLDLLYTATQEDPNDDRMAHYFARELYFRGDWVSSREQFVRHLSLPSAKWGAERSQSYRYLAKMDDFPERWLLKAVAEAPERREPWVDLAELYYERGWKEAASGLIYRALAITDRAGDYMSEAHAWDDAALREMVIP